MFLFGLEGFRLASNRDPNCLYKNAWCIYREWSLVEVEMELHLKEKTVENEDGMFGNYVQKFCILDYVSP